MSQRTRKEQQNGIKARWEHDYEAINDAIKKLCIAYPVHIQRNDMPPPWEGHYGGAIADAEHGVVHEILVAARLLAHEASGTIWHELAHAAQCERFGGTAAYEAAYAAEVARHGLDYKRFNEPAYCNEHSARINALPLEQEANDTVTENADTLLARPVTDG
jgi:hypothetical protein